MKKTLLLTVALGAIGFGSFAQNVNIPDAIFKAYLVGESSINTNADSEIQVSEASAFTGTINPGSIGISDLTGIEMFPSITKLYCSGNSLTTIDVSQNIALTELKVLDNNLTSLDVTQNTLLTELVCGNNPIGTIDVSQNTVLSIFQPNNNNLTSLDVSQNTALTRLICVDNSLTSLDLSQNANLFLLSCGNNNLASLDVSQNTSLGIFACGNNDLMMLNMKNLSTSTLTNFGATTNPNLTCIEVDDVADATANWTNIDATASFSLDCDYFAAIDEVDVNQTLSLYPNPSSSQLSIEVEGNIISTTVIDAMGNAIQANVTSTNTIDVSELANGVYVLQVETNKGIARQKFVKD